MKSVAPRMLLDVAQIAPESNVDVPTLAAEVFSRLQKRFDPNHGGFGGAPKFPSPSQTIQFLSRHAAYLIEGRQALDEGKRNAAASRDMAIETMVKIYNGGIRDAVGGGFSRYSVDDRWHVPHCKQSGRLICIDLDILFPR